MKKILSIFAFLAFSISVFAQSGTDKILYENSGGTTAGVYTVDALKTYITTGLAGGTVTSVGKTAANGFDITISNPTTTPNLTISTTVTGLLKGNGTAMSAAVAGTDYVIPTGSITGTASNVTGTVAVANGGTGAATLTGYLFGNGTSAVTASSTIPGSAISGNISGNAASVTTNANLTGPVTSVGNATTITANAIGTSQIAAGAVDLTTKVTGLLPNANLANPAITINGSARALGTSVTLGLQEVTTQNSTTNVGSTFSGGLSSTGPTTITNQINITPAATSTGTTLTVSGTSPIIPINNAATTTVTVTSGISGNPVIELPLLSTSTGSVVIGSSASETFNGASTFTVTANSQNNTIKLRKISSTAWIASLNQ